MERESNQNCNFTTTNYSSGWTMLLTGSSAAPPAYEVVVGLCASSSSSPCGLNNTIWLNILGNLVDPNLSKEDQAIGRLDLHCNVRFVCRDFYLASMHLLRSHYLSSYMRQIRPPYTTNPYPNSQDWDLPLRREVEILDLYIAISIRAEAEMWESSLLLANDKMEDLFTHHQPRARLEDLVIGQGANRNLIQSIHREKWQGVVMQDVKVDLRFKSASIRLMTNTPTLAFRTIVEVTKGKEESLERTARHLLDSLSQLSLSRHQTSRGRTYQIMF